MPRRNRQRWTDAAQLLAWALLLTPVTILLHELGHFAFAAWSGLPAQLHPTFVSGGAELGASPRWLLAAQAGGGPAVTVIMTLAGAWAYRRGERLWALAFSTAAASRLLVSTGYLLLRLFLLAIGKPFGGSPNFDEYKLAVALDQRPERFALAATAFFFAAFAWLLARAPRERRWPFMLALAAGIVAANFVWPAVMPPVLVSLR